MDESEGEISGDLGYEWWSVGKRIPLSIEPSELGLGRFGAFVQAGEIVSTV